MREVDYFIIGAGIAGMTLHRYLDSDSVVVVDPNPGQYKVGESITPQHFFPVELRPLLQAARKLPSAMQKLGTMFVSDDSVSYFRAYYDGQFTIHVDRRELEQLYRDCFKTPIIEERVVEIDFAANTVRTDSQTFRVRRQILDCSGPAMVVARHLRLAYELWPVYSSWAYWDVERIDDLRFWRKLRKQGINYFRFDDVEQTIRPADIDESQCPSGMTMLTRVRDGVWTWQIPLYHSKLLSLGVISRHGPLSEENYLEFARASLGAQFDARLRPFDGSSPHNRFHVRNHFAWASKSFASPSWALVGDAGFFGDPVYSIGTGLATSQAIRVANLLNRTPWKVGGWKIYERISAGLFDRCKQAYEHWYRGSVTADDQVASEIQSEFLNGIGFHSDTGTHFHDMWSVAAPEDTSGDPEFSGDAGMEVAELVPSACTQAAGWKLLRAIAKHDRLELQWEHAKSPPLTMLVAHRNHVERCYRSVGPFALSYASPADRSFTLDDRGKTLFHDFAVTLMQNETAMLHLVELRRHGPTTE